MFNLIFFFLHFSAHAEHYTIIDSPSSEIHLIGEITEMRYVGPAFSYRLTWEIPLTSRNISDCSCVPRSI